MVGDAAALSRGGPPVRRRPWAAVHALDELLAINAAAARLGVSVKRVYQIADEGRIGTRHGTRWLFTAAELDAYGAATHRKGGRPRKRS